MPVDGWDPKFDEFIDAAERDDRLGPQVAVVTGPVVEGAWDDGRKYYDVPLSLTTAHNFSITTRLNDKPAPEELEQIKSSGDTGRIRGVGLGLRKLKHLLEHYQIAHPSQIKPGQEFAVEIAQRKNKKSGKTFVDVNDFLPKAAASDKARSNVPF